MKKIIALCLVLLLFCISNAFADNLHASYDNILKKYVVNGMVDYKSLKANRKSLDDYLDNMSKITRQEFNAWSKERQLAYLLNLYNADTLQLIIDNYPVKSIKDIGSFFKGPWSQEVVSLFGEKITLDKLEHEIIRKEYHEPRIHLALVCAAKSCPPLRSQAYVADELDKQLDNQGEVFFNSPQGMQFEHENHVILLSSILKWYKEDFDSVLLFAQKYAKEHFAYDKIKWLDYDWDLNEKK